MSRDLVSNEHPGNRLQRRIVIWLLVLSVLPFIVPSWVGINCRAEDIDIRSGQIRYTRYFYWIPISRRIASSPVSELLGGPASAHTAEWHRVNTFSPSGGYSPHHGFHGAIVQTRFLATLWELSQFTPGARRKSAARLLAAWQQGRNRRAGRDYLDALAVFTHARSKEQPQRPVDVHDLPQ